MVKKKVSGQTIAIIVLAALLLIAIAFGSVYAFYSAKTNKISGNIIMANLSIELESGTDESGQSAVVITGAENIVPNQELSNTPLIILNSSSPSIYLIVVYKVDANKRKPPQAEVVDLMKKPVIDVDTPYINPHENIEYNGLSTEWVDYVFKAPNNDMYRCLVSMVSFQKPENVLEDPITVIGQNKLKLSRYVNNDYQDTQISFTFQAYAIGSQTWNFPSSITPAEKCETIVSAIYESEEGKFLSATAST